MISKNTTQKTTETQKNRSLCFYNLFVFKAFKIKSIRCQTNNSSVRA